MAKVRNRTEILRMLRRDQCRIWDMMSPKCGNNGIFEVVAFSSFEEKVANLRQRFFHSIAPGGLAGDRHGVVRASGFAFIAQQTWKIIKDNKDIDLPAHKVMVAIVRCEEIGNERCTSFRENVEWCKLDETVQSEPVPWFGKKLGSILHAYLSNLSNQHTT